MKTKTFRHQKISWKITKAQFGGINRLDSTIPSIDLHVTLSAQPSDKVVTTTYNDEPYTVTLEYSFLLKDALLCLHKVNSNKYRDIFQEAALVVGFEQADIWLNSLLKDAISQARARLSGNSPLTYFGGSWGSLAEYCSIERDSTAWEDAEKIAHEGMVNEIHTRMEALA